MDWINKFYSRTGKWWGPAEVREITDRDRQRAASIKKWCGSGKKTVLELGSGYGNTAAATAEAGHDVIAVEISDRADFSEQFTKQKYKGSLKVIKEDFYNLKLDEKVDIVTYWNGFGIGEDSDQQRLLRKTADE